MDGSQEDLSSFIDIPDLSFERFYFRMLERRREVLKTKKPRWRQCTLES